MAMSMRNAPSFLISLLIGISIMSAVAVALWNDIIQSIVDLAGLGANNTFASLYTTTGVFTIVLSAVLLIAILKAMGVSVGGVGGGR